jgi:hypothetical protein
MRVSRRRWLAGAALSAATVPLFARFARPAFADDADTPRRLIVLYSPNGTVPGAWTPTSADPTSSTILAPLAPWQEHVTTIDGLGFGGGFNTPHSMGTMKALTNRDAFDARPEGTERGVMTGPSLETVLARDLGGETLRDVLRLSVSNATGSNRAWLNFTEEGTKITPTADPAAAFAFLFPAATGTSDPGAPDPRVTGMLMARRSVLDVVRADATRMRDRLPAAQRPKLEAALEAIRAQERALSDALSTGTTGMGSTVSCETPAAPGSGSGFVERTRLQIDNLVAGMACDLVRFGTLMMAPGADSSRVRDFDPTLDGEGYHDCSHRWEEADAQAKLVKVNVHFASMLAYLIERLASMPEGTGTMLDHTIVLWTNECWHGNHDPFRLPLVLAGHAGGLAGGRVYTPPDGEGRSYGKLLVSLANAVGHPMTSFGDPRWGAGPLPGLFG